MDMWEPVDGPDAVQTPAEVYAALAGEGLGVHYLRVPVTDGKAPSAGDIDAIMRQVGLQCCLGFCRLLLQYMQCMSCDSIQPSETHNMFAWW